MSLNRVFVGAFVAVALCLALTSGADAGIFRRGCCPPADCCAPPPPVETTLYVCHPCTGCKVPFTVCVPACCAKECPAVRSRPALIGKQLTTFSYWCGFEVKVRWDHCVNPQVNTRG